MVKKLFFHIKLQSLYSFVWISRLTLKNALKVFFNRAACTSILQESRVWAPKYYILHSDIDRKRFTSEKTICSKAVHLPMRVVILNTYQKKLFGFCF